jgi:hypothetical protein
MDGRATTTKNALVIDTQSADESYSLPVLEVRKIGNFARMATGLRQFFRATWLRFAALTPAFGELKTIARRIQTFAKQMQRD